MVNGSATYTTGSLTAGSHTITAAYQGNGNWNTASPTVTQVVGTSTTTVVLSPSAYSIPLGGQISYTMTVTVPASSVTPVTGTVLVFDSIQPGTPICSTSSLSGSGLTVTATCPNNPITYAGAAGTVFGLGSHTLSAQFNSGNTSNWANGTSAVQVITVGGTATSTATPGSSATASYNYPTATTLSTTVTPTSGAFSSLATTGTVTFYDGSNPLAGSVSFNSSGNGQASLGGVLLTPGTHVITARYSGDTNYAGSVSPALNITVAKDPYFGRLYTHAASRASAINRGELWQQRFRIDSHYRA